MRARIPAGLAFTLALVACQASGPGSLAPATPAATRSAKPAPVPSGVQPAPATGGALLRTLPGGAKTLSGHVVVDARYAVGFGGGTLAEAGGTPVAMLGGGKLVGNAGGTLVGNAGGTLVGNAGGTLVGNAGGTLVVDAAGRVVAAAGGNVVVPAALIGNDGSTLIGNDGSTLIGNDGSTLTTGGSNGMLIGNDGSTLVGNAGGTLVGNAGGTYRLAQAAAGAGAAFGEVRPAVGMWLSVVDARTGFTVPLGTDDAGKPVYAVYTDLAGDFKVQIPAGVDAPRVLVRAPGLRDPKLVMNVIPRGGDGVLVDAQHAATTAFFRSVLRGRLLSVIDLAGSSDPKDVAVQQALIAAGFGEVKTAFEGIRGQLGADRVPELGILLADALLADIDVHKLTLSLVGVTPRHPAGASLAGRNSFDELVGVLKRIQDAAAVQARGAADPATFFAGKPYLIAANLLRSPEARWRIDTPADLTTFLAEDLLGGNNEAQNDKAFRVLEDLGLDLLDRDRLAMASATLFEAMLHALVESPAEGETLPARLAAVVRGTGARLATAPRPQPRPAPVLPPLPTPPAFGEATVDTLDVMVKDPLGMAIDASTTPAVLYVADQADHSIQQVTFDAAGVPTARKLTDQTTGCLAYEGNGSLLALHADGLERISTREADFGAITRVVSIGRDGFQDGPAGTAKFAAGGQGMAIDPVSHDLFVADLNNHRLRRIDLDGPERAVTTVIGSGFDEAVEGPIVAAPPGIMDPAVHPGAAFTFLTDVAFGADGTIYTLDAWQGVSVVHAPITAASRLRLLAGEAPKPAVDAYYHNARLNAANAVAMGPDGNLVVAESGGHRICVITPEGWVHALAGTGQPGQADGPGSLATFQDPYRVAAAPDGTIFVAPRAGGPLRRIRRPLAPAPRP